MKRVLLAIVLVTLPVLAQERPSSEATSQVRAAAGAPRGVALSPPALDEETQRISSLLRCPVCQGLSIADSPAPMALNMKAQVRDMLAAGYTEEQVLRYFEGSYGSFVRLDPPKEGINWIVWLAPALFLFTGLAVVLRVARGARSDVKVPASPPHDPVEDPALSEALKAVRAAYRKGAPEGSELPRPTGGSDGSN